MKTSIRSLAAMTLAIIGLAFFPDVQAVSPPPDGGYPGGNTAEGQNALLSLATGQNNTAVGLNSLSNTTTSSKNTAIGAGALRFNTGESNTASGAAALRNNTSGGANVANGADTLENNTTGVGNTAIGRSALFDNIDGSLNTAVGLGALASNRSGGSNTAIGEEALADNTTGVTNTAIGGGALSFNTTGRSNVAVGESALDSNTIGAFNTAVGSNAGHGITGGVRNTAIGEGAGRGQTNGSDNVYIGANVSGMPNENDSCYIGSIFGQSSVGGVPVVINSRNKLGTVTCSKRFKENIKSMDKASQAIFSLKPVTFRYKSDDTHTPQFGLVAEEVAEVDVGLVVSDKEGKPYTVRYEAVNAMLLNEFLKEHRKVEEQQATISELRRVLEANAARQQKQIEELATGLQKVSGELEMARAAGKVASR